MVLYYMPPIYGDLGDVLLLLYPHAESCDSNLKRLDTPKHHPIQAVGVLLLVLSRSEGFRPKTTANTWTQKTMIDHDWLWWIIDLKWQTQGKRSTLKFVARLYLKFSQNSMVFMRIMVTNSQMSAFIPWKFQVPSMKTAEKNCSAAPRSWNFHWDSSPSQPTPRLVAHALHGCRVPVNCGKCASL